MTAALPPFDRHRRLLFSVAYRMLGSVSDAEDVVQDTWLRWSAADRSGIDDARAYLVPIATRLALDRLRSARSRRESYVGPWLPEPLLTGAGLVAAGSPSADPPEAAEVGKQVSLALLVVLETLSPRSARCSCCARCSVCRRPRWPARWAAPRSRSVRRHTGPASTYSPRRPRFDTDRSAQPEVTERFLAACAGGDVAALVAVLAPDVVLVSDGGGKARSALRPVQGPAKVARFLAAVAGQGFAIPGVRVGITDINGAPGVAAWAGEEPLMALSLVVVDGAVEQVLIVRNPDKLSGLQLR